MRKTKRITSLLLALCMLMAFIPNGITVSAASAFGGGSGTETDPYIIEDAADFIQLSNDVNSGTSYEGAYFALTDDVTLTTEGGFNPIGKNSSNAFKGNFDGQNHTVTLDIAVSDDFGYIGIFGYINGDITIKNIRTEGSVTATGGSSRAGGIVAYRHGGIPKIINCHNNADITAVSYAGGICGNADHTRMYNCSNGGTVTATSSSAKAGGIAGCGTYIYITATTAVMLHIV